MSGPNDEVETQFLAVTNKGKDKFFAKFHGDPYEWLAGETVNISVVAAQHIFGFGGDDDVKTAAFLRSGWLNANQNDMKVAYAKLDQFDFAPVLQVFTSDASKAQKRKGKVIASDRGSRPGAGESSGDADTDASPRAPDVAVGED